MNSWNHKSDDEKFEEGQHSDLDYKTFNYIYVNRPKWVQFTLIWESAKGQYKRWLQYCRDRNKYEQKNKPVTEESS